MSISEMLGQTSILLVLGMGTVFTFLIILILAVTAASKIMTRKTEPHEKEKPLQEQMEPSVHQDTTTDQERMIAAAVGAAVYHQHIGTGGTKKS